jgi:hypothetical protein
LLTGPSNAATKKLARKIHELDILELPPEFVYFPTLSNTKEEAMNEMNGFEAPSEKLTAGGTFALVFLFSLRVCSFLFSSPFFQPFQQQHRQHRRLSTISTTPTATTFDFRPSTIDYRLSLRHSRIPGLRAQLG